MKEKKISGTMLILLLSSLLFVVLDVPVVVAAETIYIRADGSIDPPTAPIQRNGDLYTVTGNITSDTDGIVIQRNNMTLDGADYTIQGTNAVDSKGIDLTGRSNVTIKNMEIKTFDHGYGIRLDSSSNNSISGNNITNTYLGIFLYSSSGNSISGNNITNNLVGIGLDSSSNNSISGNNITNNWSGIGLSSSSNNSISGNNITANNQDGIWLYYSSNYNSISGNNITANNRYGIHLYSSSNNSIYHNNFESNTQQQVYSEGSINVWDDGYPSGGNYWSDYTDVDLYSGPYQNEPGSDDIWDHPYVIDVNNQDPYPLVNQWACARVDLTVETDKPEYYAGNIVQVHGDLTLDGVPVDDGLVGLQIQTSEDKLLTIRTLLTGNPPSEMPLVLIDYVAPCDQDGNPKSDFGRGTLACFKCRINNTSIEGREVFSSINTYYNDNTPFGWASVHFTITPESSVIFVICIPIPTDAILGTATVYANAYTDWPKLGGTPYCSEVDATFQITDGTLGEEFQEMQNSLETLQTDETANYNLEFRLPQNAPYGDYTTYVTSRYSGQSISNSTTFTVYVPGTDSFRFPLDGSWTVSQRFGRWNEGFQGYHLGEDILRSSEVPVYAPANGVVKHNAKHTGYGYVVIIEHRLMDGSFVCSVLGHLREVGRVPVGATVAKGQIVGYLSSVPEENGGIIHLHLGIRKGMYSEELDYDGKWRYRGYGPAAIVDYWHPPSQFIDYYNIQKTPTLPEEEGLRVTITSDKTFYQLDETINFNVTVTNPTNETGINVIAHNSSLIIEPPDEIELENPQTFYDLGDLDPGESRTLNFTAIATKAGTMLKTWARAAGEDLQLGLSMIGASLKQLSIGYAIPTEWSFAVITDLHIGRSGCSEEVEGRLQNAVSAINALRTDGVNITFVLVLGDITDAGGVNDFYEAQRILNRLNDPNQDGDTSEGIPYIPLIGNHDVKSDMEWCFDFVFWSAGNGNNWDNRHLIDAKLMGFERQDRDESYYQNYYFSYDGLDFLCLDVAGTVRDLEVSPATQYPEQTRQFVQHYFDMNRWENFVLTSHFPLYEWGGFWGQDALEQDINSYNCNVTNLAGHTHRNYETWWSDRFRVIETEAVCQVEYSVPKDFPEPVVKGDTIRIVNVKNGEIDDYSILKNPEKVLEEHRELWRYRACLTVEGFGSYIQPNKPAVFKAYCPTHHGFETSFQWAFGDGDHGSSITVSHSYLQEGDYNVTVNITKRNLFTNETTITTIVRSLCVRTKHIISVLPPESFATSFPLPVDLTETPTNMYCQALIGENDTEGEKPVAIIGLHFENANSDIDLSNLLIDTDTATRKSIVFSAFWPAEADCDKWLFVPSSGAGSVYVCLNATTLDDVKLENANFIVHDGETLNNITVASINYEGKEYYLVYGNLTGLGAGEIFAEPKGYPVVDFALHDGRMYAATYNTIHVYDGSKWDVVNAPTFVTSIEPYEDKLIVGGQGGLYSYNGTAFNLIFTVPTYVKVLGAHDNKLYAGTMLDKSPTLYYCDGPPENPNSWHQDAGFSVILNFSGPFGSIDSFAEYDGKMYIASGDTVYSYNGTNWSIAKTYDDVYAYLDLEVYNGKLYLATRDQGWRKPIYQGGTGFSGRVIEYDGENWTTILDHDYWIYSLGIYDNKLYVGTANKILTYNGITGEASFNATEGAYYALCFENYGDKIYVGMGNGYIFADPAPET